jgi:hypothetical protein
MMKTIQFFFAAFVIAAMISCTGERRNARSQQANEQATEYACTSERQRPDWLMNPVGIHTSELSLDFFGTYEGVLPSGSGMGIRTVVTLNQDRTFELTREYLCREDNAVYIFGGYYTIEFGEIVVLDLGILGEMFFDLREGSLALLDNEMNRIEIEPWVPRYELMMKH